MINQVIKTPTKGKEYFGFSDTDIVVSSKKHADINAHIAAKDKSGLLESVSHIAINDIKEVAYNQKDELLKIKFNKKNKLKTLKMTFASSEVRNNVASSLSELKNFKEGSVPESKWKPLLIKLFFVLIVLLVTAGLVGAAHEAANGGEIEEFTGRRSGIKNLLVAAATALGPIGVGIIGGLGTVYLIYSTVKRWQNPALDISYN